MEMTVYFRGGKRVNADYKGFTIETDQPIFSGGESSAPAPFDLFLASIATCAGIYILSFCQQRNLPTEDIKLIQRTEYDQGKRLIAKIQIEIQLPTNFPEKYHAALIRSADLCAVKRHLFAPPAFDISITTNTKI